MKYGIYYLGLPGDFQAHTTVCLKLGEHDLNFWPRKSRWVYDGFFMEDSPSFRVFESPSPIWQGPQVGAMLTTSEKNICHFSRWVYEDELPEKRRRLIHGVSGDRFGGWNWHKIPRVDVVNRMVNPIPPSQERCHSVDLWMWRSRPGGMSPQSPPLWWIPWSPWNVEIPGKTPWFRMNGGVFRLN